MTPATAVQEQGFDTSVPSPGGRIPGGFPGGLNSNLQSAMLRHRHFLLMAENSALKDLLGPLRAARESLMDQLRRTAEREGAVGNLGLMMDQRRRFLRTRIDEITAIAQVESTDQMRSVLQEIAEKEQQVQANILRREIPGQVSLDLVGPDLARLQGMVNTPLGGARFAERMRKNYGEMATQLKNQLGASIVLGEGMDAAARRLRGVMEELGVHRSTVLARSEIQRVANQTAMDLYQRNADVIKGMQWVGTLDERTCLICGSLDGEFYELAEPPGFPPPAHPQCRCFLSPVTKSWEELGIDREEMPAGTRASMDGQVPASTKYEEWFATQSPEFQRGVLGPTRFEKYKTGDLAISDFADVKSARVIPVKELPDTASVGQTAAQRARAGGGSVRGFDPRLNQSEIAPLNRFLADDLDGIGAANIQGASQQAREVAKGEISQNLGQVVRQHPDFRRAVDDLIDQQVHLRVAARADEMWRRGTFRSRAFGSAGKDTTVNVPAMKNLSDESKKAFSQITSDIRRGDKSPFEIVDWLRKEGLDDVAGLVEAEIAERAAAHLVKNWAVSSADNHALSQALQLAAKREFGLDDAVTSHFGTATRTVGKANLTREEITDQFGDFLQRFQRAQYEATQEALEAAGIDHVTVFRGMKFDNTPAWLPEGGGVVDDIVLQPASSFSSQYDVSLGFGQFSDGGVMVGIRVPVNRVLGTARTGFGCLHEGEFVLLGGEYEGFAIPIGRQAGRFTNASGLEKHFQTMKLGEFFDYVREHGYVID